MSKTKLGAWVAAILMLALAVNVQVSAQETGGDRGRDGGGRPRRDRSAEGRNSEGRPGPGGFNRDQMRERMAARLKEVLGTTDDEWAVIGPMLENVTEKTRQLRGGPGGFMGRGGPQGGPRRGNWGRDGSEDGQDDREPTAIESAQESLRTTLDNPDATAAQIKSKLTALREARETAKQELAQAQAELKDVLTLRQEAQLILMGLLE